MNALAPSDRKLPAAVAAAAAADARGAVAPGAAARIDALLAEATLERPPDRPYQWFGKQGAHSEHLGYMLAEMQYMQRTYPGARW